LAIALDVPTLFVIATATSALIGMFLLSVWQQERIRALAWWGSAYLIGGFSVALWSIEGVSSPVSGLPSGLLFFACGMIWSAARLFHGRPVLWVAMSAGAMAWLLACLFPSFLDATSHRVVLCSLIISIYTYLTARELWRERRKSLIRRWPALFVPVLHGIVFLAPLPLASLHQYGVVGLAGGWFAVFALEAILYSIGVGFIVVTLSKERSLRVEKSAAFTDPLTGLFNRRGFFEGARRLKAAQHRKREPIAALIFDLDCFKSVNDRFGHFVGDEVLLTFTATISETLRATDLIARFGGEEFVVLLPGGVDEAAAAAERVRRNFEEAGREVGPHTIGATVSVGVAAGPATAEVAALLVEADGALYRAKSAGRNCVATAVPGSPPRRSQDSPESLALTEGREAMLWAVEPRKPATEPNARAAA
jgi:diguanylate cyclase (GGDEF)-like protein